MHDELLLMKDIRKVYYPDVIALEQANFSIKTGEIHAIAGENGAGKTTLMKILFGMEKANQGELFYQGEKITIQSPNDAMKYQIGMVHQHFMLVENMTVAQNIVLGIEPKKKGLFDMQEAKDMTKRLGEMYDMRLNPNAKIRDLSVGLKQKVEIIKVLARDAKIIILDEPTAILTPQETKELFHQLKLLKQNNYTIIIITHKLREIKEICDRVTIMKSGRTLGTFLVNELSIEDISKKMVGYDFDLKPITSNKKLGQPVLVVKNLLLHHQGKPLLKNLNFSIKEGELVGIIGVEGNGQRELAEVLTGVRSDYEGQIFIDGQNIKGLNIQEIRQSGLSYIPEDRMVEGANLAGSIFESAIALKAQQPNYRYGPFLKLKALRTYTEQLIVDYKIKCENSHVQVKSLSGGNIQKIVSAREISENPRVLVANQPTRGIDIGAVLTLHDKLKELQDNHKAILLISSDLKEVYDLARTVIVLFEGEIVAKIDNIQNVSEEQLGKYMLGIERQSGSEAS